MNYNPGQLWRINPKTNGLGYRVFAEPQRRFTLARSNSGRRDQDDLSLPYELLGDLVRTLNPDELKTVSGDVFGRIYEYFLTQFADQKAHDGGEFFTPISLVSFIANVLEPEHGTVFDPACGSGGMFVQSARVVERHHKNPSKQLTSPR